MPGPDVVRCNQYKTGVVGDTRISKKYLIKYGCFGNHLLFGRAHELVTRFVFFKDHIRHVMERATVRQYT